MIVPARDLVDFLLARIAEDERDLPRIGDHVETVGGRHIDWAARVAADCEGRRAIVGLWHFCYLTAQTTGDVDEARSARDTRAGLDAVLQALAMPYADHPDYQPEWRP